MNIFFIIICSIFILSTNSAWSTELKIDVHNIDVNIGGNIVVMFFGKEGSPKSHGVALLIQIKPALHKTMEFIFDVDIEELAVKVLHDETGDGKVTKNWTGIWPKEGLGFSNKQKISLKGAPKYKCSKLLKKQFENGINISITYP